MNSPLSQCPYCGSSLRASLRFCEQCGAELRQTEVLPEPSSEPLVPAAEGQISPPESFPADAPPGEPIPAGTPRQEPQSAQVSSPQPPPSWTSSPKPPPKKKLWRFMDYLSDPSCHLVFDIDMWGSGFLPIHPT